MSEVLKVPNTVLLIKDQSACWGCQRSETLYCNTNKGSKGYVCWMCQKRCLWLLHNVHCIQSNVTHITHVGGVKGVLYSVYSGLSPLPGGKAISKAFHLGGLAVHHPSV